MISFETSNITLQLNNINHCNINMTLTNKINQLLALIATKVKVEMKLSVMRQITKNR